MKKLLEVCQYGDCDIRFNTDIQPEKLSRIIPGLSAQIAFSMMTQLWGGIEQPVLAVIRALAVADLAASANRKEMLRMFGAAADDVVKILKEANEAFTKSGGQIVSFGPGVMPPKAKS
jgi:hypothetical protein